MVVFSTTLLVYCSAIYPQGKTLKYGLGGRLSKSWICPCIYVGFCRLNMCPQLSNAASAGLCDVPRNTGWESSFLPCFVLLNMLTCLTDSTLSLIGHKIISIQRTTEPNCLRYNATLGGLNLPHHHRGPYSRVVCELEICLRVILSLSQLGGHCFIYHCSLLTRHPGIIGPHHTPPPPPLTNSWLQIYLASVNLSSGPVILSKITSK